MTRRRLLILPVILGAAVASSAAPAQAAQAPAARQVTMFCIHATPAGPNGVEVDPKLKKIEPQLRKLFPDKAYSFKLVATDSKRLTVGQSFACKPGDGWVAKTQMVSTLDADGNLQLRFVLDRYEQTEFSTIVKTPPNQLFFCDKQLEDGSKLLIGLGGR